MNFFLILFSVFIWPLLGVAALLASPSWAAPASLPSEAPETGKVLVLSAPKSGARSAGCLPIKSVELHGVTLVSQEEMRQAITPLVPTCLDNAAAQKLVAAVNEVYSSRGYVTTQGYVRPQDIKKTSRFVIHIVVGRVARRVVVARHAEPGFWDAWKHLSQTNGVWDGLGRLSALIDTLDNPLDRLQILPPKTAATFKTWLAMPVTEGDVLQLEAIQQGIDQLNKAASHKAEAKLEPGEAPATSNVVVNLPRSDSFRLSLGYEMNGASLNSKGDQTGKRLRFDLSKDNLIGINDLWTTSLASGVNSNEARASLVVPIRWAHFSLDAGYSESLTPLTSYAELFNRTFTLGANTHYLVSRDRAQQTAVTAGLNWRQNERYINDLALIPQTFAIARLGASHTRFWETRQVSFSSSISQGLEAFNATKDPVTADQTTPRAQFLKLDGAINYIESFKGLGMARLDMSGQWSRHPLYADDQLVLGSSTSVRGFTRNPFSADMGLLLRGEFASKFPQGSFLDLLKTTLPFLHDTVSAFEPYVFVDYGAGRDIANRKNAALASAGVGTRFKLGRLNVDFAIAKPLYNTGITKTRTIDQPELYLTVSTKIF